MPTIKKTTKRPWIAERKAQEGRHTTNQKLYNSADWRKCSTNYRLRNPLCEVSAAKGMIVMADVTDHIIRIEAGGSVYDPTNHMAMSSQTHNKKSGMERSQDILITFRLNEFKEKVPIDRTDIIKLLNNTANA